MTKIEEAARLYVEAIETHRSLKKRRGAMECEHEWRPSIRDRDDIGGEDARPTNKQDQPCWKWIPGVEYAGVSYGEPYGETDTSHHHGGDPSEWCEPCRERERLHGLLRVAARKIGPAYLRLRFAMKVSA